MSAYITGHIIEVSYGYHLRTPQYAEFVGRKVVEYKNSIILMYIKMSKNTYSYSFKIKFNFIYMILLY